MEGIKTTLRHLCYWFPVVIAGKTIYDCTKKCHIDMNELIWDGIVFFVSIVTAFLVWRADKDVERLKVQIADLAIQHELDKVKQHIINIKNGLKGLTADAQHKLFSEKLRKDFDPEILEALIVLKIIKKQYIE